MKTKVVIIDDDINSIKLLTMHLAIHEDFEIVASATNCCDGKKAILENKPDLLFLDIELPEMDGLSFLRSVRNGVDWCMSVVFFTSYDNYTIEALRLEAFDYLLKPLNHSDLESCLQRYVEKRDAVQEHPDTFFQDAPSSKERVLLINTIYNQKLIRVDNIGYFRFQAGRKVWEAFLDDGSSMPLRRTTTSDVIVAQSPDFVQVHKMYIVNLNFINTIEETRIVMNFPFEEADVKISKSYRKNLLDRFYSL